ADRDCAERHQNRRDRRRMRSVGPARGSGRRAHVHRLGHVRRGARAAVARAPGTAPAVAILLVWRRALARGGGIRMKLGRAAVAFVLLLSTAALARSVRTETLPEPAALAALPFALGGWRGQDAGALDAETVRILAADEYLNRTYEEANRSPVGLYVAYY